MSGTKKNEGRIALVLSGGAARGAYEAGVVQYLREGLPRETGVRARFDVLCGSSVGAINACFLAATMDRPDEQGAMLVERWCSLELEKVVRVGRPELFRFGRSLLGIGPAPAFEDKHGGLLDPSALERVVTEQFSWAMIQRNIAAGRLHALAVSATHVASGRTVVFVEREDGTAPTWENDPFIRGMPARMRPQHALASAAIPLLFPAVQIDGRWYCDGGVRLNTPLSPALRLGADRVLVVSLRYLPPKPAPRVPGERTSLLEPVQTDHAPSPYFLAGRVLNALWLDHVDYDYDRLHRTNEMLAAGTAAFGPEFTEQLNAALIARGAAPLRRITELRIHPSTDIGAKASEYARSDAFAPRATGMTSKFLRRFAAPEWQDADLASYLLFDGGFARELVDLGYADTRAQRDELARFFDGG